jgi:hypothetical protein
MRLKVKKTKKRPSQFSKRNLSFKKGKMNAGITQS